MDWTVNPLHATNLQTRNFQVQGMYQSQQPASGFSQASATTGNSSVYTGKDQAIKMSSIPQNMVANQVTLPNNVGSNNFQPTLLKASVPVIGFGTTQHFAGLPQRIQLSNVTVQTIPKNTWPNSNIISPVASQPGPGNNVQRSPNLYITSNMYNNRPQKNCSNYVQASVFQGNNNNSRSKRLPKLAPAYQPADPQTHATVHPNQVSNNFLNSQPNSSCLTFSSGQNINNQINYMNPGSATAMQSQQYASNCVYSPYTIPTHYAAQAVPQATNTNLPPPPYTVPPIQIDQREFVQSQPVLNRSTENVQNPQNLEMNQSSGLYSAQYVQTLGPAPISREPNKVGGTSDSMHRHSTENQPSDEVRKSVENLKSICNSLHMPETVPPDKTPPQTSGIKSKPITKESLELDMRTIFAIRDKLQILQNCFKLKHEIYQAQKSKPSDPSVHNPALSPPSSNTSQQPIPFPQATHQTFSLPSHDTTQKPASLLPHDNTQNQPPSLPACSSHQSQDNSSVLLTAKSHLHPILHDLLKGTCDTEMMLKSQFPSADGNQIKQSVLEKCSSGAVLDSSGAKSETNMSDMERVPRLSLETLQTASIQRSLTSTDAKQTSLLDKAQLTDRSTMSGGNLFNHFVLKKDKTGMTVSKILTDPHSIISVQNPTASSESSPLSEKLAKERGEKFWNFRSEVTQQSKDCLSIPDKNITDWNKGNNISSSSSLAVPEAGQLQRSFVTGNSCTVGRACSLEELETSLALWKKGPSASLNDHFGESTKSTVNSSPLNGTKDEEMVCAERNFPDALSNCGKSSIAVVKNETILSSFPSSLGQKLDAINSNSLKCSEPQVAIVSPLILSKDGIQNEVQEKNLSSVLETTYPVIAVGSIQSLCDFVHKMSDIDKPVKRTACSPSDSCVTVKEVCPDIAQKMTKSTGENGMQRAETETDCSCDPNQRITGPLQPEKNTPPLCSRDGFPLETDDSSSPVSQKCSLKTSPDLVKPEDTVLNKNILQISSVCTLVQGDVFYDSQIASIFNSTLKSKAENNTSSEDQRPDSYHKEQPLSLLERDCEINESTSVGDAPLPPLTTLSKAIAEKLLSLPGAKISQRSKVSDEVDESNSKGRKITELCNPNSEKDPQQSRSCSDVHSTDSANGNREVPGNSIVDEGSAHSTQEHVPSDETQAHSVNNIDIAPTSPNDQLSELLKEFPYGIYDSKVLNKTENEDSATKLIEIKDGQENQTFGQNSDANHSLDQITVNILNPQQMKELFPESNGQLFNRLENRENDKVLIMSEGADEKHIVDSTNSSAETVQEPASQSYCCLKGWISIEYNVDPCDCRLHKETSSKQQQGHYLPSEIIIKEEPETNDTSNTSCRLNNLQQTIDPVNNSNLSSKDESNRIWSKSIHKENNFQQKEHKPLKEDEGLIPFLSLEKSESLKPENKQQKIEKLPKNVQIELCNQKCTTLVSKRKELLYSEKDCSKGQFVRPAFKRELSDKERTPRETVGGRSKSDTPRHSMENKRSKKKEQYKIKHDSSETHIIKGPSHIFKRRLKKHTSIEGKQKTSERPFSMVTQSSSLSSVDLVSKTYNNAERSQEHLNRQKCKIDQGLENNKTVRTDHNESSSSEAVQQNKGSLVWTNLKKFVYPEERGKVWQNRRSLSGNIKTSKLQIFRRQHLNTYKSHSSGKEAVRGSHKRDKGFPKTHSDKKSPYDRKSNTLTLQREQNKSYLNKVGFRQTERSICLTKLVQSPSKSIWHVKSSGAAEQPEEKKNYTQCSQQSEVIKPQMLEFKMCPEIVFKNLVSEEVPDAKKLSEKETTPVAAVKSTREDWLNYIPLKKRKVWEKETQVDRIPLGTVVELLDKDEAVKKSNATFETYRKMHLEKKRSRSLDSSPLN